MERFTALAGIRDETLAIGLTAVAYGSDEVVENEKAPVHFVSADPPSGSPSPNMSIMLIFDGVPEDVETSAGVVVVSGRTVTINGSFIPGQLIITVSWLDDQSHLLIPSDAHNRHSV